MISVEGVTYFYPDSVDATLTDIELNLPDGELVALAGNSGSGKSTLLRALNGLVPRFYGGRFHGRVAVDGVSTGDVNPSDLASKIGFVGQDPETGSIAEIVEDDIIFTLENLGFPPNTMRKRLEEVLDALGIAPLRGRRIETLSGGERQRAAIASALVAMPKHLILDEPTSQLDPQSAEDVIGSIMRLRDEVGLSAVIAEHRLDRIVQQCDRLCVLEPPGLVQGKPREVMTKVNLGPPVVKLARELGWSPLPLGLKEAWLFAHSLGKLQPIARTAAVPGNVVARCEGLSVSFGGKPILKSVDFTIGQGEVVALMGRNGSGKTTLLRTLAGLVQTRGKVTAPSSIAYVPQNPETLLFMRTVRDELSATLRGHGQEVNEVHIGSVAETYGIESLLQKHPADLSGGQKTIVAMAAAACAGSSLVLLDEPTRGLDEPSKDWLIDLIDTWRGQARGVVVATHDVELAASIADRVVILGAGEVVVEGSPHETLSNSLTFSTQINKVFRDPNMLTVKDVVQALASKQ